MAGNDPPNFYCAPPDHTTCEGQATPHEHDPFYPPRPKARPEIPRHSRCIETLPHGEMVGAVAISNETRYAITGGKGCVKIWDLYQVARPGPAAVASSKFEFKCFENETQIRALKQTPDGCHLVVGGDVNTISVWDFVKVTSELPLGQTTCYALAISSDSKLCYSCYTDGDIAVWDMRNKILVKQFHGHTGGATCMDLSIDGHTLRTGGMDRTVRSWDLRQFTEKQSRLFSSPVHSVSRCPTGEWLAVGLEDSRVKLIHDYNPDDTPFVLHMGCVRALKFAHSGRWFVSGGDDGQLSGWKSPEGNNLFLQTEPAPLICCDISKNDEILVTGSGNNATLYTFWL